MLKSDFLQVLLVADNENSLHGRIPLKITSKERLHFYNSSVSSDVHRPWFIIESETAKGPSRIRLWEFN